MTKQRPDVNALKAFNAGLVDEFRANGGKAGGQHQGANLLLLTTTGAKSGQPRVVPLAYLCIDNKMLIVGAYAGADIDPAWAQPSGQPTGARRSRHGGLRRDRPRIAARGTRGDVSQNRCGRSGSR